MPWLKNKIKKFMKKRKQKRILSFEECNWLSIAFFRLYYFKIDCILDWICFLFRCFFWNFWKYSTNVLCSLSGTNTHELLFISSGDAQSL
jgi:hypothetical protein